MYVHWLGGVVINSYKTLASACEGNLSVAVIPPLGHGRAARRVAEADHCCDDRPAMFADPVTETLLSGRTHLNVFY